MNPATRLRRRNGIRTLFVLLGRCAAEPGPPRRQVSETPRGVGTPGASADLHQSRLSRNQGADCGRSDVRGAASVPRATRLRVSVRLPRAETLRTVAASLREPCSCRFPHPSLEEPSCAAALYY